MHAYIVLCLLVGVRAEEARALRWDHVGTFDQDSGRWLPVTEAGWEHDCFAVATALGTVMDPGSLRRMFRRICRGSARTGLPGELRHTFVSLLSDPGMRIEETADLVGHASSRTTETVYRHQLRPVIQTGASVTDGVFPTATTE